MCFYANDKEMQMYGIIKQSASDRLPGGNRGVRAANVSTG